MMPMGSINGWAAGAATTALGLHQYYRGKRMRDKNKRPTYEIPEEVKQNLSQAQNMALQGIPEEQKQQYLTNLQRGSAQSLASSGSRRGGLAGIAGLNQQQNDGYANLLSMDAAARFQNQGVLMNQRQNMADYRDQAFQINKMNPYYEKEAEGLAMQGAGQQNIGNSFQIAQGKGGNAGSDNPNDNGKQGQGGDQMSSQYWNQKSQNGGMKNYNSNSSNGFGDYNYDGGTQYGGYG